jgi:intracellular sulfur oxidation DsrE/DsrF family protein
VQPIEPTGKPLPAPVVVCDKPMEGSKVSRGTLVSGWSYSPAGIREVSLWLEGQQVGRAELGLERPDVARAHPEWVGALRSGFHYRFKIVPATVSVESTELTIVAEDDEGRRAELQRIVQLDESLFEPILICDRPVDGSTITHGTLVSGWSYSPAGIREVSLWLEGQQVGRAELGLERPGVARAHPEWVEALHSGFHYRFQELPFLEPVRGAELVVVAEDERGRRAEIRRVVRRDLQGILKDKLKDKKHELRSVRDEELKSRRPEFREIGNKAPAKKDRAKLIEHMKRTKRVQQEVFELERELRAAEEGWTVSEQPVIGALPDFVVIGGQKGGTTSLYHLLTQHPYVEPAASKELHFFDIVFELGIKWYRGCFPVPRWEDGWRTITGEATPYYLFHPRVPERMAQVVPQARLIALLRNPIDRAYSHHHQEVTKGSETLGFEEAIEAEEARLGDKGEEALEDERYASVGHQWFSYLSRGIYVDQLLRWSEFFRKEQMLVLKSEDFFESPKETLGLVLDFLGLPEWEFETLEIVPKRRNAGDYEQKMDPSTRRKLEEYFEPHNKRLYKFLGRDFGW